jgi:TatD DNase family protein
MIDIGPNLSNQQFRDDIEAVLRASTKNNVETLILTSTDFQTYHKNLEIIEKYGDICNMSTTLGLHPHHADKYKNFFLKFDEFIKNPKVISIGEFGLDYFRMISTKENQLTAMNLFLDKAAQYPLPLFMHEREAKDDFISILKSHQLTNKKIVHCFTGNKETLKIYLDLGCYIGITGWVTEEKRGKDLRDAVPYIPMDRLMIETDCPYLTPKNMPSKTYRNEPQFLKFVAMKIAELKNIPLQEVIEQTVSNSLDFFQLPKNNATINSKKKI